MYAFLENQTEAQINTALTAGGFAKVGFAIVGPDTRYTTGSVTVQLIDSSGNIKGYRTAIANVTAAKTYIASLVSSFSLSSLFNFAVIDDGQGVSYTISQVESW